MKDHTFKTLEELPSYLNTITPEAWNKLFNLIPEIEQTESFGKADIRDGTIYPTTCSEIVYTFHQCVYELGLIIDFPWMDWEEGKKIITDEKIDFYSLSPETLCKLLTAIVRSDRFCDGALVSSFENGTVLGILKGLRRIYG
ncbi:MAG: DUF6508 domain-containing protein [Spirochaetia bacterium]|nr:DUF6508 domain-containing protein [Spirochaetia bacterium]